MSSNQTEDCGTSERVEYQWLKEDFLSAFVGLFSQLHQTQTRDSDISLDVVLSLARTLIAICPSVEGRSRDIASKSLGELTSILSLLSFEKAILAYEALTSGTRISKFARYFLYKQLYKRLLRECETYGGEKTDTARAPEFLRDTLIRYVATVEDFLTLEQGFEPLQGDKLLPRELVLQFVVAVESMGFVGAD